MPPSNRNNNWNEILISFQLAFHQIQLKTAKVMNEQTDADPRYSNFGENVTHETKICSPSRSTLLYDYLEQNRRLRHFGIWRFVRRPNLTRIMKLWVKQPPTVFRDHFADKDQSGKRYNECHIIRALPKMLKNKVWQFQDLRSTCLNARAQGQNWNQKNHKKLQ